MSFLVSSSVTHRREDSEHMATWEAATTLSLFHKYWRLKKCIRPKSLLKFSEMTMLQVQEVFKELKGSNHKEANTVESRHSVLVKKNYYGENASP